MPNELAHETSPYLLQHAHNPVHWRPWGPEAIAEATRTDKLLIVSVGYAACHWCHVMERESFEDEAVAAAMNADFVSVKVDREERPDVDDVYMAACQLSGGEGCGWPLNAIALPDGRPVWAGTYFPRDRWLGVLASFVRLRREEPHKLEAYAQQIADELQPRRPLLTYDAPDAFLPAVGIDNAAALVSYADPVRGGFGGAPKFPMPVGYAFLLAHVGHQPDEAAAATIHTGLTAMARGGIYDQLGGGFARYSVDARWHVPHFEKMLYDNAQLLGVYARAYRWSGREEYAAVVRGVGSFLQNELASAEGMLCSSLDADSEGVEGKFYVWDYAELRDRLPADQLRVVTAAYQVTVAGNWREEETNVLHRPGSYAEIAEAVGSGVDELQVVLAKAHQTLLAARGERVRPGLDDKVLVSWNGLALTGLTDAYLALGDVAVLAFAKTCAAALWDTFAQPDGRLLRTHAKGRTHVNAFLDDYANLAVGLLDLYGATFDEGHLARAEQLVAYALAHFGDPDRALLYYTSDLDGELVARRIEEHDNVTPGSNSVFAELLWRLGSLLDRRDYRERAERMLSEVLTDLSGARQSLYRANWLRLYDRLSYPHHEIAFVGPEASERRLAWARHWTPSCAVVGSTGESELPLLRGKYRAGETWIYVCEEGACRRPVRTVREALALLEEIRAPLARPR